MPAIGHVFRFARRTLVLVRFRRRVQKDGCRTYCSPSTTWQPNSDIYRFTEWRTFYFFLVCILIWLEICGLWLLVPLRRRHIPPVVPSFGPDVHVFIGTLVSQISLVPRSADVIRTGSFGRSVSVRDKTCRGRYRGNGPWRN